MGQGGVHAVAVQTASPELPPSSIVLNHTYHTLHHCHLPTTCFRNQLYTHKHAHSSAPTSCGMLSCMRASNSPRFTPAPCADMASWSTSGACRTGLSLLLRPSGPTSSCQPPDCHSSWRPVVDVNGGGGCKDGGGKEQHEVDVWWVGGTHGA